MTHHPDFLTAPNPGLFTLDGTRSYLVGSRTIAIIDPGPDVDSHVRALTSRVAEALEVQVVLTHGHADHSGAAPRVAAATGAAVLGPAGVEGVTRVLADGDAVSTDQGDLVAVHTPGHTREHLAFHWPRGEAAFVGDLLLGQGDTTWVADYPGCVADYLASLERVRGLGTSVLYPAHGPPLTEPEEALDRFEHHRRERIEQVRRARAARPDADPEDLVAMVYGDSVPKAMRAAALESLEAVLDYLREHG